MEAKSKNSDNEADVVERLKALDVKQPPPDILVEEVTSEFAAKEVSGKGDTNVVTHEVAGIEDSMKRSETLDSIKRHEDSSDTEVR